MDIKELQDTVVKFRNARDWKQFHTPKNISISLVLEAVEVMEHFQWKDEKESEAHIRSNRDEIGKELIDVLYWVLLICHDLNIDISKVFKKKMAENNKKYSIKKSRGKHIKYTEL